MRVIENNYEKKVTCKRCESVLAYTSNDIKEDGSLKCPLCGGMLIEPEEILGYKMSELIDVNDEDVARASSSAGAHQSLYKKCNMSTVFFDIDPAINGLGYYELEKYCDDLKDVIPKMCRTSSSTNRDYISLETFWIQYCEYRKSLAKTSVMTRDVMRRCFELLGYERDTYLDGVWGLSLRNHVFLEDGIVYHPQRKKDRKEMVCHNVSGHERHYKDGKVTIVKGFVRGSAAQ